MRLLQKHLARVVVLVCLLLSSETTALAANVCLRADAYQITAGSFGARQPAPITMWGFFQIGCGSSTPAPVGTATKAAIPVLKATAGDTLDIQLTNNLTGAPFVEPVSIIIPGQPSVFGPPGTVVPTTWDDGSVGNRTPSDQLPAGAPPQRVRSFTKETAPGQTITYTFGPLKAGTYLIQSGTHPAVQMQMGLYGVLEVYDTAPVAPATSGRAYPRPSPAVVDTTFNSEVVLLLSEIDPALHAAVASGNYGPGQAMTSTVDYHPKFFLVNGAPFRTGTAPVSLATNKTVFLRFLNAGLATKVPLLQGQYVSIVAEDGNLLPAPRQQYTVLLPAGKTMDAILTTPAAAATIPVYDRRLDLSNNGVPAVGIGGTGGTAMGGMFVQLKVCSTPPCPP